MSDGWIGVDLDGTLAEYEGWQGVDHIGKPIPRVLAAVKAAIAAGETIKIFTARVAEGREAIYTIERWLIMEAGLPDLEITNVKDQQCKEIWDDRAVAVERNTGRVLGGESDYLQ